MSKLASASKKSELISSPKTSFFPSVKEIFSPKSVKKVDFTPEVLQTSRKKKDTKSYGQLPLTCRTDDGKKKNSKIKMKLSDKLLEKVEYQSRKTEIKKKEKTEIRREHEVLSSENGGQKILIIDVEDMGKTSYSHFKSSSMPGVIDAIPNSAARASSDPIMDELVNKNKEIGRENQELKQMVAEKNESLIRLEITYRAETSSLSQEVEALKVSNRKLKLDLSKSMEKSDKIAKALSENIQCFHESLNAKDVLIKDLNEHIKKEFPNVHIDPALLKHTEIDKKLNKDNLKGQKNEHLVLTDPIKSLYSDLAVSRKALSQALGDLENEKFKSKLLEKELEAAAKANQELSEKLKEQQQLFINLENNHKELQHKHSLCKKTPAKTENSEQTMSKRLSDAINGISDKRRNFEARTLKRTNTLNPSFSDSSFKLFQTLQNVKEENISLKEEYEKANKDLESLQNTLEGKDYIISRLQEKSSYGIMKNLGEMKENMKKHLESYLRRLELSSSKSREVLKCKKCCKKSKPKYILWPCEHVLCKNCSTLELNCPVCGEPSKFFNISILKIFYFTFESQEENLRKFREMLELSN